MHIPPIVFFGSHGSISLYFLLVRITKLILPVKCLYPGQKGEDLPVLVSHVYPGQGCHPLRHMEGTHSIQQSSNILLWPVTIQ